MLMYETLYFINKLNFSPLKFKTDYVDIYQYLDRRFWLIYRLKNLSISETHCTSIATASA